MTYGLQERQTSPKRSAIIIWTIMSLGPAAFFLSLLWFGVELLAASRGGVTEPPSDLAVFGPVWAVVLAEIAGAIIAYVKRGDVAGTLFESHATSAIRTFWIMLAGFAVSICLCLLLLMVPNIGAVGFGFGGMLIFLVTLPLLFAWKTFRIVRGLRRAVNGNSIADHPTSWS